MAVDAGGRGGTNRRGVTDGPAADVMLRTGRFFSRRIVSDDLRAVQPP